MYYCVSSVPILACLGIRVALKKIDMDLTHWNISHAKKLDFFIFLFTIHQMQMNSG